jgi:hypothetical protein
MSLDLYQKSLAVMQDSIAGFHRGKNPTNSPEFSGRMRHQACLEYGDLVDGKPEILIELTDPSNWMDPNDSADT